MKKITKNPAVNILGISLFFLDWSSQSKNQAC